MLVAGSANNIEQSEKKSSKMRDLGVRSISGAIYTIATIACCLVSPVLLTAYVMAIAAICAKEFSSLINNNTTARLPETLCAVFAAAYPLALFFFDMLGVVFVAAISLVALLVIYVLNEKISATQLMSSFFGSLYTGGALSALVSIYLVVGGFAGQLCVLLVFVSVWACDSCAYLIGVAFGKHKLSPHISPKKSWEGLIAGIIASIVVWVLFAVVSNIGISWWLAALFGLLVSVAGVLGDLAESRFKRTAGVKDSGTLLPGHGGLLDRTDSILLAAPVSLMGFLVGLGVFAVVLL